MGKEAFENIAAGADADAQECLSVLERGACGPPFTEAPRFFFVKSVDAAKRQVRVLASTADRDRDGEIIRPDAFRKHLATFMANPVILAGHQHRSADGRPTVVGKAVKAWIDGQGLWLIIEFAKTALGEEYWVLYRDGIMKAVSVGFIPIQSHEEVIEGKRVRVYDEAELLEVSCVAVPSNRQALVRSAEARPENEWLAARRADREEHEEAAILDDIRREYAAQGRDFDAECDEFAEALLGGGGLDEDGGGGDEIDFVAGLGGRPGGAGVVSDRAGRGHTPAASASRTMPGARSGLDAWL